MTAPALAEAPTAQIVRYAPYGGARELFYCRDSVIAMDGPAGTGKTRSALEKMHLALMKYPGSRWLIARKSLIALKSSTLVTYREKVIPHELANDSIHFFSSRGDEPAHYAYSNGSKAVIVGLDKPGKAMSTEYDGEIVDEATDCQPNDTDLLKTRLRNGVMPYQQQILCMNPQGPTHWIAQGMTEGRMRRILSRHEDNPRYWDRQRQEWTHEGVAYIAILDSLTGVRKARLRDGQWVAAEGAVYEEYWDAARNLLDRDAISKRPDDLYGDCGIDRSWPRYMVVDFGHTHPFVCRWFAEDPDGRLYAYREIYMSNVIVQHHAEVIQKYAQWGKPNGDPMPRDIIADHDGDGRATLEFHLGISTIPADKRVIEGIQKVQSRLLPRGDGKPRLYELKNSVVERDKLLAEKFLPTSTIEEYDMYLWDTRQSVKREAPIKEYDHGLDATRYLIAYKDLDSGDATSFDYPW